MTPAEAMLIDVTSRAWLSRDDALTGTVDDALLEVMPQTFRPGFATGHAPTALPFFIHQETWLGFFLVFGERVEVGISEVEAAAYYVAPDEDGWRPPPVQPTPTFTADVAPFLVSERSLDDAWAARLGALDALRSGEPARVDAALAVHGMRLPTEAEVFACWRLEQLAEWPREPGGLWRSVASEVPPSGAGRWFEWLLDEYSHGLHRLLVDGGVHERLVVRPVVSLLPDAIGYCDAAVAARGRWPALSFERM